MRLQETYLKDILERIDRLDIIAAEGKSAFLNSFILQDAMIRNFEVLGEAVKQLLPSLIATQPKIEWKSIAGFRDVLIHDYAKVDLEIVWSACVTQVPALKIAIKKILDSLNAPKDAE